MLDQARTPDKERINEYAFDYYFSLRKVRTYVEGHYSKRLDIGHLAGIACMEKKYFSRFFHRKVGITFSRWLAYYRVCRAMKMMEEADFSITKVGYAVGFEDLRTFERAFKRVANLTPRQFKMRVRPGA